MGDTNRGFTLIELMVAIAIIAVLAAVAIPSYQTYINKANREEIVTALMSAKTAMLRFRMDNGHYNLSKASGLASLAPYGFEVINGKYGTTVPVTADQVASDTTFSISARHSKLNCHLTISLGDEEPRVGTDGCSGF